MAISDRFAGLRAYTVARIGLGRSGPSIATSDHLAFRVAHALARDAVVHAAFDLDAVEAALAPLDLPESRVESLQTLSGACDQAPRTGPAVGGRAQAGSRRTRQSYP
jgi:ethanolamine ammonia-lyase small subunit